MSAGKSDGITLSPFKSACQIYFFKTSLNPAISLATINSIPFEERMVT